MLIVSKRYSNITQIFLKLFSLSIFFSVISILSNMIIQKYYDKNTVAIFFLSITLIEILSVILPLGRVDLLNKILVKEGFEKNNWRKYVFSTKLIIFVLAPFLIIILFFFIDSQSNFLFLLIILSTIIYSYLGINNGILKSSGNFNSAILASRVHQLVFLILLLLFIASNYKKGINIEILLFLFFISLLIQIFIGNRLVNRKRFNNGCNKIETAHKNKNYIYILLNLNFIIVYYADRLVLGKLDLEDLALYSVFMTFARGFDMVYASIEPILIVKLKDKNHFSFKNMFAYFMFAIGLGLIFAYITPYIIDSFYEGKYIYSNIQIYLLSLIGVLKLFSALPNAFINGNGSFSSVYRYSFINIIVSILYLVILILLSSKLGINGVLITVVLYQFLRMLISYYLLIKHS
ncbi:hypothetical protein [Metabacillus idriensis]|uniref:hypothetical protein n=1 Tax=Metabacillus idriensis TaxID=324768 RepID=UPI00174B078C|nr:hypothetical protein [Metabacillus idriensis]